MEIYIPTLNRTISDTVMEFKRTYLGATLVSDEQNPLLVSSSYPTILAPRGIGKVRQFIIDGATSNKVVMVDDDLTFATRRGEDPTKFRPSTADEICDLFARIDSLLDKFAHVGVSTREGGNRDTSDLVCNTRLLRILAYRVDVLRREDIRFDRMPLMEDFDVTLSLLERGYPNVRINSIVHNQRSSNAPGGCSTYRTIEEQGRAARRLQELHPQFVSIVTKKTKTAWNGQEREDVIIQWKRAFDSAGKVSLLDQRTGTDTN